MQWKRACRRLALLTVAVAPGVMQGLSVKSFTVEYQVPLRTISLTPPTGAILTCKWVEGSILLSKAELLDAVDERIQDRRNHGRPTEYWEARRADVEHDMRRANGNCRIPPVVAAALLERGHATVTTAAGERVTQLTEWSVAWVYDGRPAFYSHGDGRAFMRVGARYQPDPEADDCGSGCVLFVGDHSSHANFVI